MCCFRLPTFTASIQGDVKRDPERSAGLGKAPKAVGNAELPLPLLIKEDEQNVTRLP